MTNNIKIQAGKFYRTRDGRKVGPMAAAPNADWLGQCETEIAAWGFHKSGRFGTITGVADGPHRTHSERARDLIAEWTDAPTIDLTAITTPFGLLDDATQKALQAHGGPYEMVERGGWMPASINGFWIHSCTYRVKPTPPEPKIETITIFGSRCGKGWLFNSICSPEDTHRIIFNTIDGEPDCGTYRMEPV